MKEVFGHTPLLNYASTRWIQDGNTLGTTGEMETIEIRLETQMPGEDPFFVIKTGPEGWSIDNENDIVDLINRTKQIMTNYEEVHKG